MGEEPAPVRTGDGGEPCIKNNIEYDTNTYWQYPVTPFLDTLHIRSYHSRRQESTVSFSVHPNHYSRAKEDEHG